jgi:DNA-binding response OmpR family regulator
MSVCNRGAAAVANGYAAAMSMQIFALLVEDDERLARFTAEYLEQHGVIVSRAGDGEAALQACRARAFDVVILDLMLPRRDGLDVCRELRVRSAVPILMVTARTDETDRVVGLELGADDYLGKPFSARELLARVRALVRRSRGQVGPEAEVLRVGPLELRPASLTATVDGRLLELTSYEFSLLRALAERSGRTLSREQLLELAKGAGRAGDDSFDRSIDVRISRIRQKLGEDPRVASLIRTVRGVGYMMSREGEP